MEAPAVKLRGIFKCKEFRILFRVPSLIPRKAAGIALAMHFQAARRSEIFPAPFASGRALKFAGKKEDASNEFRIPSILTEKYNLYPIYISDEVGLYIL
jgi:hypothetical protein